MAYTPQKYIDFNAESTKSPVVVVCIDGLPQCFSTSPVYTRIRYGDPDVFYGDNGLVYGGLRRVDGILDYVSLEGSSLSISQTIEPERGKGSVSQMTLQFVDIDTYMTRVISPGVYVPEIMGREVKVSLGYQSISYPEDYFQIFRGYISEVISQGGRVTIKLSDPNVRRRQKVFFSAKTKLASPINSSATTINVVAGQDFHTQVIGPNGSYDPAISTYVKIEDEYIEYPAGGISGNTLTGCIRGARGTTAVSHSANADCQSVVEIEDHGVDLALKLMLSTQGAWKEDVAVFSLKQTPFPSLGVIDGAITMPVGVDAVRNYGLSVGDYVTISNASLPANNVSLKTIVRFISVGDESNRIIVIDDPLQIEFPTTPATLAFRSKYDTYPSSCALGLSPLDVDVSRHEFERDTFLLGPEYSFRFLKTDQETAKEWLEEQVFLGMGAYSLTQRGKLSMGVTKPPLADQNLVILSKDSALNPEQINPMRTISGRFFYNEISYEFDFNDDDRATAQSTFLDSESVSLIGQVSSLPVSNKGIKSDLTPPNTLERRSAFLLSRFKRGAVVIKIKCKYEEANQIEIGDVVGVRDQGGLLISNFQTGTRDLGVQLFEVQQRNFDIRNGTAELMLVAGVGAEATDRYATIGPASVLVTGSTTTRLKITDSFATDFPGDEARKWESYVGANVTVHNEDWTIFEETVLQSVDPTDRTILNITPALSFTPLPGYIVDCPIFPDDHDPTNQQIWKLIHAFFGPRFIITNGISNTQFDVSPGDVSRFVVGATVYVHSPLFTYGALEKTIASVSGNTITLTESLGFTPASGDEVDLYVKAFPDGSATYRFI